MKNILNDYCVDKISDINKALEEFVPLKENEPNSKLMFESMHYSLFAGGKRLRPIMVMAAADAVGGKGIDFLPVACALEMIHTYSLIHDDLPAMDNDDYRRGKLTNHKVYGDGIAILAGDGLLTAAFETVFKQEKVSPEKILRVAQEIAVAAGAQGMVGGQAVDLVSEGKEIDESTLKYIHEMKTGALFKASIRCGAILANATEKELELLTNYAECFGLAFQITDDILDVTGDEEKVGKPIGSDERNLKQTYVSIYSLEGAIKMAEDTVKEAKENLSYFGEKAKVLEALAEYLITREA